MTVIDFGPEDVVLTDVPLVGTLGHAELELLPDAIGRPPVGAPMITVADTMLHLMHVMSPLWRLPSDPIGIDPDEHPPLCRRIPATIDPSPVHNVRGIDAVALLGWARTCKITAPINLMLTGQRGLVEHVIHEIGHALTLHVPLPCSELADAIDRRIDRFGHRGARYNEAVVLAAEIWLFSELGEPQIEDALRKAAADQGCLSDLHALRGGLTQARVGRNLLDWLRARGYMR